MVVTAEPGGRGRPNADRLRVGFPPEPGQRAGIHPGPPAVMDAGGQVLAAGKPVHLVLVVAPRGLQGVQPGLGQDMGPVRVVPAGIGVVALLGVPQAIVQGLDPGVGLRPGPPGQQIFGCRQGHGGPPEFSGCGRRGRSPGGPG